MRVFRNRFSAVLCDRSPFAGVMVCDRCRSYDAVERKEVAQQKCVARPIRNASAVAEGKTGAANSSASD